MVRGIFAWLSGLIGRFAGFRAGWVYYVDGVLYRDEGKALRAIRERLLVPGHTMVVGVFKNMGDYCWWRFTMMHAVDKMSAQEACEQIEDVCSEYLEGTVCRGD